MNFAITARGAARLLGKCDPRWVYDYDAPSLSLPARLERLHQALLMARRRCTDPGYEAELSYALEDCEALMALARAGAAGGRRNRVEQRIARMRRLLAYHEGRFDRLNRRYWWVPFSLVLIPMLSCGCPELLSLFM